MSTVAECVPRASWRVQFQAIGSLSCSMSAWWGGNLMAVVDEELREQLFADAPAEADLWMGDVNDVGGEREIVPFVLGVSTSGSSLLRRTPKPTMTTIS